MTPEQPRPDRPLDQLQVVEARHILLYVSQTALALRTAVGALHARPETQQLLTAQKVTRGVEALIDDLETLLEKLR